ncbi:MAG: hypothetical protein ACRYFX_16530 [Janthinobacterium lividum]
MNLLQFIELLEQGTSAEEIAARHTPHSDAEELEAYMENKASLTSELAFFDFEQVPPTVYITVDGKQYEAFFSVSELAGLITEHAIFLGTTANPLTIAESILHYHEYDA